MINRVQLGIRIAATWRTAASRSEEFRIPTACWSSHALDFSRDGESIAIGSVHTSRDGQVIIVASNDRWEVLRRFDNVKRLRYSQSVSPITHLGEPRSADKKIRC